MLSPNFAVVTDSDDVDDVDFGDACGDENVSFGDCCGDRKSVSVIDPKVVDFVDPYKVPDLLWPMS
jgi:hypothetical protein